jgi:hypothetical protein
MHFYVLLINSGEAVGELFLQMSFLMDGKLNNGNKQGRVTDTSSVG